MRGYNPLENMYMVTLRTDSTFFIYHVPHTAFVPYKIKIHEPS